jgi:hypothetical protein
MPVSARFRKVLQKTCEELIELGYSCFPKRATSKAPAFKRGESYQKFLVTPVREDPDFAKLVLKRFEEDPWVGGIALAGGVGGLVLVDYDPPKVSREALARARKAVELYGSAVYAEFRAIYDYRRDALRRGGYHFVLRGPIEKLTGKKIRVGHGYKAEFAVKHFGLVTVHPSILVTKTDFSLYLRESSVELKATLYDRRLDTLPRLVEALGGKLVIAGVPDLAPKQQSQTPRGQPYHGLDLGIASDTLWRFLKEYAVLMDCPGLYRLVESLEKGEPMPIPYFIYQDYFPDTGHPRSSWTIVENLLARILAEAGAGDDAFEALEEALRRSEELYEKRYGPVDHRSLRRNIQSARRFNEFGHDKAGACIFKVTGLCSRECTETGFIKLARPEARQAMARAYARAKGIA